MRRKRCAQPGVHGRSSSPRACTQVELCACGGQLVEQRQYGRNHCDGGERPLHCPKCKNSCSRYSLRQQYIAQTPIAQLASEGVLHEVTTARLCDFLWGEGLPTNGLMQDILDRCYEHLKRGRGAGKDASDDSDVEILEPAVPAADKRPKAETGRRLRDSRSSGRGASGSNSSSSDMGSTESNSNRTTNLSVQTGPDVEIVATPQRWCEASASPVIKKLKAEGGNLRGIMA